MRTHDQLLQVVLAFLHHLVYFARVCIELVRHYADTVARSPLVLKISAWMSRAAKRPWIRKCRNALYNGAAFIVGSTFEDEYVAFTAQKLVKNDVYRDRLLVPEIDDLVALCDALRLTLPQRKAYFQCFLRVDFMRRSSVSRAELLRYCNLRATPLTNFLLPDSQEATHRETARNRWDIMQLMATCFSICTADIVELVQLAVMEAIRPQKAEADESDNEKSAEEHDEKEELLQHTSEDTENIQQADTRSPPSVCQQIGQCLACFVGVPDPLERSLQALLIALYDDNRSQFQPETTTSKSPRRISFLSVHGVSTLFDVVRLFPVLVFPCIWTQRVLRTRILGVKTWQYLQQRRMQLQPCLPTGTLFVSAGDIVAASQVQIQQKRNRENIILTPSGDDLDSAPSASLLNNYGDTTGSDCSASSKNSTPRKVIPCTEQPKSDAEASSFVMEAPSSLGLTFDQCSTLNEAWRVTANHALASVYIQCLLEESSAAVEELETEFARVTKQIFAGKLSTERSERIRQRLVKEYGYRFAHTLFAKSNLKELSHASKTPSDERRATQRYAKAWRGSGLVEDKVMYWKEFEDPVAKRPFYYNVRTGESRWEKPANFVGKKKARRRRKPNSFEAQEQLV